MPERIDTDPPPRCGRVDEFEVIEPCEVCGGDCGFSYPVSMCHIDGSITYAWDDCRACGGTGEQSVELLPIELEDLDEIQDTLEGFAPVEEFYDFTPADSFTGMARPHRNDEGARQDEADS